MTGRSLSRKTVLQAIGDFLKKHIAHGGALRVVDAGEIIDIEHQYGDSTLPRHRPLHVLLENLQQSLAVGQRGQRIVIGEVAHARLALAQLVLRLFRPHQEFHALGEEHWIDAFRGEIRRARVVGTVDRIHVVEAGLHQDGYVSAFGKSAQGAAHVEPAHAGHHHVENDAVDGVQAKLLQGARPIRGEGNAKSRHFQCRPEQQACSGIVVDDEYASGHMRLVFKGVHWIACLHAASADFSRMSAVQNS